VSAKLRQGQCPRCTDLRAWRFAEPDVRATCRACGYTWKVSCGECGRVVSKAERFVDAGGASHLRMVCECGVRLGAIKSNSKLRSAHSRSTRTHCDRCDVETPDGAGQVDHIIARRLGGEDALRNQWWLCVPCHKGKTASDIRQIAAMKRANKADRPLTLVEHIGDEHIDDARYLFVQAWRVSVGDCEASAIRALRRRAPSWLTDLIDRYPDEACRLMRHVGTWVARQPEVELFA